MFYPLVKLDLSILDLVKKYRMPELSSEKGGWALAEQGGLRGKLW